MFEKGMEPLIMSALDLGAEFLIVSVSLYLVLKVFMPAYFTEKAKNIATKEDIGSITKSVESVKAGYAELLEEMKSENQIKVAAIEREKTLKKEVYMEAVEAITISQNMISMFPNMNLSEAEITSGFSDQSGKIAKIQIVGSKDTVKAVTTFMGAIGTAVLDLMLERQTLNARLSDIRIYEQLRDNSQSEISRYIDIMKTFNLQGVINDAQWNYVSDRVDHETKHRDEYQEKIDSLWLLQNAEHVQYVRRCMDTFFGISKLLPDSVLAVRAELDLEIDPDDYLNMFNDNLQRGKAVFDEFLSKIQVQ